MGEYKEAPYRGARKSAAATVRVPRNGKFGYGEFHIGALNAGKASRMNSSRPIIGIIFTAQLNGMQCIRPTDEEALAKTHFR